MRAIGRSRRRITTTQAMEKNASILVCINGNSGQGWGQRSVEATQHEGIGPSDNV